MLRLRERGLSLEHFLDFFCIPQTIKPFPQTINYTQLHLFRKRHRPPPCTMTAFV